MPRWRRALAASAYDLRSTLYLLLSGLKTKMYSFYRPKWNINMEGCFLVAKIGGFRDTTQGYLVLWVNYTFCTWGQCAGVYPLLRSKNTKCQSALTFVGAYASWHSFPIAENGHGARRLLTLISFRAKTHHGLFLSAVRQMPLSVQDSVCSHRKYRR